MELKLKQRSLDILGSVLLIVLNGIEIPDDPTVDYQCDCF